MNWFAVEIEEVWDGSRMVLQVAMPVVLRLPGGGGIGHLPFLYDTGTEFTLLSKKMAELAGISRQAGVPRQVRGASGVALDGRLVPVSYSFAPVPCAFHSEFLIVDWPLEYALLALRDVHPHFTQSTTPQGLWRFDLRQDHRGTPIS